MLSYTKRKDCHFAIDPASYTRIMHAHTRAQMAAASPNAVPTAASPPTAKSPKSTCAPADPPPSNPSPATNGQSGEVRDRSCNSANSSASTSSSSNNSQYSNKEQNKGGEEEKSPHGAAAESSSSLERQTLSSPPQEPFDAGRLHIPPKTRSASGSDHGGGRRKSEGGGGSGSDEVLGRDWYATLAAVREVKEKEKKKKEEAAAAPAVGAAIQSGSANDGVGVTASAIFGAVANKEQQAEMRRGNVDTSGNRDSADVKHAETRLRCDCEDCEACRAMKGLLARNGLCISSAVAGRRETV